MQEGMRVGGADADLSVSSEMDRIAGSPWSIGTISSEDEGSRKYEFGVV